MCVAVPMKIVSAEGTLGVAELGGVKREVSLVLVPEAQEGDYVLVHAGFAISVIDQKEAQETLRILKEELELGKS